jgi:hypothetical protein
MNLLKALSGNKFIAPFVRHVACQDEEVHI